MKTARKFQLAVVTLMILYSTFLFGQKYEKRFKFISPKPGAEFVSKSTTLIMRPAGKWSKQDFNITLWGSLSGEHEGNLDSSDDGDVLIFKPTLPFLPSEKATVTIRSKRYPETVSYDFFISNKTEFSNAIKFHDYHKDMIDELSQNHPSYELEHTDLGVDYDLPIDFPTISVITTNAPSPGSIFLSNFSNSNADPPNVTYLLILDNDGQPAFFNKIPSFAADFKKQPNGLLTYFVAGKWFFALDSTYTLVDEFMAGNGYATDIHELQLKDNGHALLMIYDEQTIDMSQIVANGDTAANVIGMIIQEIDTEKKVVFEWRSWDHFEITDATHLDLTHDHIDYVHGNTIELDHDGNLLISSRHMDEITKIDRVSGDIIWRLGGVNNQFTFINDELMFSRQHDIRRLANGNITLFDNGNFHNPPFSRAIEYELDETNKTATLVWEYRHSPDYYSSFMGNVQRLPNGNTLIGWGGTNPNVTEVRPDGSKVYELTFVPNGIWSYRAFRFEWNAKAAAPYLWADTSGQRLLLNFTKFGDPDVLRYRLYRGGSPNAMTLVDSTEGNSIQVEGLMEGNTYFFRVTALNSDLAESPFSNNARYDSPLSTKVDLPAYSPLFEYSLKQNYPNPFNAGTNIRYVIPQDSHVLIKIFNLQGQEVITLVNERQTAGIKNIIWDGKNMSGRPVSSGLYVYALRVGKIEKSGKMLFLK